MDGAGPIPWTAIIEWTRMHGMDREPALLLADVIRYLDVDRMERIASERRTQAKTPKPKTGRKP